MYKQVLDPVSHSLGVSSIFAVLPLVVLFLLLGVFRMKAQWASLLTLLVAALVAVIVYSMPVGQAGDSALEGAVFGFWPIMWIVINALWLFNMTEATGHFEVLKRAFATVSDDLRVQVVVIAFCFGALLEALAGFGTPVAICGIMLVGLGVKPIKAAAVALVADTAPVAFGAIAIPITTLAQVTGLPVHNLGQMVGRQTPFLALIVPFVLVFMIGRPAWSARDVARRTNSRVRIRVLPVPRLELRQRPAHRHHRVACFGGGGRGVAECLVSGWGGRSRWDGGRLGVRRSPAVPSATRRSSVGTARAAPVAASALRNC